MARTKQTTVYPSYGYRDRDGWVIPLRAWVRSRRHLAEFSLRQAADLIAHLSDQEEQTFQARTDDLVADSRSNQMVRLVFDRDPTAREHAIADDDGRFPKTDRNGLIRGWLRLTIGEADAPLEAQGSRDGWLSFQVVSPERSGRSRIRLIEPEGRSVISDIDDTIKITEIPAGAKVVVRNTFVRPFAAAPDLAARYQQLSEAGFVFHYVSGGPWQLYGPLADYLIAGDGGFPEGSFHMKEVNKNLLEDETWEGLYKLARGNATFEQKIEQISTLMEHFPGRLFTLIGDSGEADPEVFGAIRNKYPRQVEAILIRDVLPGPKPDTPPDRLRDMQIIQARPVFPDQSQFGQ